MFEWWLWLIHGAFFHSSISERKEQACAGESRCLSQTDASLEQKQDNKLWYGIAGIFRVTGDRRLARVVPEDSERISPVDRRAKAIKAPQGLPLSPRHPHPNAFSSRSNHRSDKSRTLVISSCSVCYQVTLAHTLSRFLHVCKSLFQPGACSVSVLLTPAKQPCRHAKRSRSLSKLGRQP